MTTSDLIDWIVKRYGPPSFKFSRGVGVYLAAVQVHGGIAFGYGSNSDNALYDLYCDLCLPSAREPVAGLVFYPWEIEQRKEADAELLAKLKK